MWTAAVLGAALGLAACAPHAEAPAAKREAPAPDRITVVGYSGILARAAILFQRPDKSLTQCFFAEGRLSHCSNVADPQASVAGYSATGSDEGRRDGDEAALLLQRPDGSLSHCALAEGALSACTDAPAPTGRIVGYHYFADASGILFEAPNGALTHCWIEAGRFSECSNIPAAPGRVVGFNEVGHASLILFSRADGALAECSLYEGRLSRCSTFTAPFAGVAGYNYRHPSARILFTREDGSLVQCSFADGALSDCADVPPPP
jgi:hypothetical protein